MVTCSWPDPAEPVDQQPQHLQLVIGDDRLEATDPDPDQGDRMGIGVVGLAALTVANIRILADIFACTSTTCSPAASSR